MHSKAYRVLKKRSKKIEETYYVTFDDSYVKKLKTTEGAMQEIFPKTSQVTVPISNLFEQYMFLFDEPEKAIDSESKAEDNKVDSLKQIIDDAAQKMDADQPKGLTQANLRVTVLLSRGRGPLYKMIMIHQFRGRIHHHNHVA